MTEDKTPVAGRNGVVVTKTTHQGAGEHPGFRTYEVHQRERVGESTENIKPIQLVSDAYRHDPYPFLEILRENYPCYRDWLANCYWLTQYNDVTSVLTDDANFESRPKTWYYDGAISGRDLTDELAVLELEADTIDQRTEDIASQLIAEMEGSEAADLTRDFAARLPLELLGSMLAIPKSDKETFFSQYWRAQRGTSWMPELQEDGRRALRELETYFAGLLKARHAQPGEDLLSRLLELELVDGPVTASDVVVTILAREHETLQGSLANLWYLLLTHPQEFDKARSEQRLLKLAYLEALRHSTPVLSAQRFTRHEVERFGKLLPAGALVVCSTAAANRDPRIFAEPDKFIVDRKDLCQREPRGQYRADGLASGIAFGLGKPSIHPAVPEDRPRSKYALNRDAVVMASSVLLEHLPNLVLMDGASPSLTALTVGEMHTCWQLPVKLNRI